MLNNHCCSNFLSRYCINCKMQRTKWYSGQERIVLWFEFDFDRKFSHVKLLMIEKYPHTIITEIYQFCCFKDTTSTMISKHELYDFYAATAWRNSKWKCKHIELIRIKLTCINWYLSCIVHTTLFKYMGNLPSCCCIMSKHTCMYPLDLPKMAPFCVKIT